MNILVTGGVGYIGSVVAADLLKAGHSVIAFNNLSRGHREAVPLVHNLQWAIWLISKLDAVCPDRIVMHFLMRRPR